MSSGTPRRGRVVDASDHPIPGAMVSVVWGTAPFPEIALLTDADGMFQLALPPGRFRLRAYAPDGASGDVEVAGGQAGDFTIRVAQGPT
jgi:Carboxypeptidase regulatory-like domain